MATLFHVRTIRTSSGATGVQIVSYEARKLVVKKHLGSAHTTEELRALKETAADWIERESRQTSLFAKSAHQPLVVLDRCRLLGVRYTFAYDVLRKVVAHLGFTRLGSPLLVDLTIMRIIEPASKLRSVGLLERYFGIRYPLRAVYRTLPKLIEMKERVEGRAVEIAKAEFGFDFSFVFYDVTTLYFESFTPDELRKNGFSKDNKSNQPQIVIGLMVTRDGFPVAYDLFTGNTFEGHTFLPVLQRFVKQHHIKTLTIVADAAMLSFSNMETLKKAGLRYIVGARLANCSPSVIAEIARTLEKTDGKTFRIGTDKGDLVCGYSQKRAVKDSREIEKQLVRAKAIVLHPGTVRRAKFVSQGDTDASVNEALVTKAKLLAGIKGYYSNLPSEVEDATIIAHYHDLWHVEHAFRIAKNDLESRPIFHHRTEAIKAHVLLCFVALVVSKYMELRGGCSIRAIVDLLWSVVDARIVDPVTEQENVLRSELNTDIHSVLEKLFGKMPLSY